MYIYTVKERIRNQKKKVKDGWKNHPVNPRRAKDARRRGVTGRRTLLQGRNGFRIYGTNRNPLGWVSERDTLH
jgi:hypothetical protein